MKFESVNKLIESSFRANWEREALSNYHGATLRYKDLAELIEKIHICFEKCGLEKGDKVSLCARNQANWGVCFLAATTYGAVPVPILHEFKSENIHYLVNHSESKVFFVDETIWEDLSEAEMPGVQVFVQMNDLSVLFSRNAVLEGAMTGLDEALAARYPDGFSPVCLNYHEDQADELALINYTSGTSGFSKGVMIPYRALCSNIQFAKHVLPELNDRSNVVSMLPSAHMYGMMFEFLFEMSIGMHVHFLTRTPSPKIIMQAFEEIKPNIIIAVPLIIEKVYKSKIQKMVEKGGLKTLLKVPVIDKVIQKKIRTELVNAFGNQFIEVIMGGAAFNKDIENFFWKIGFPYTVGYGMTECAPIITYARFDDKRLYSCGKAALNMQIRIDSEDPQRIEGEIQVSGPNVALGYFKNPQATADLFTEDGWLRTGDMGIIDAEGYLYIRGRSKCMILGPNGQNIYPEEIEAVFNAEAYIVDSLVIEDNSGLTALIYPDYHQGELDGLDRPALEKAITELLPTINKEIPNYAQVRKIEFMPEDFERTPKRSIKRYLYQRSK